MSNSRQTPPPAANIEVLNKTICYSGFFQLTRYHVRYRLFQGGWSQPVTRELFEHPGAVAILPYDTVRQKIILVEQFRIGMLQTPQSAWCLEPVAGMLDSAETPEQVARREVQEETNSQVMELVPIYHYWPSPGCSSESFYLFCGHVDSHMATAFAGLATEHEDIKVHVLDVSAAFAALAAGAFNNAQTIIALQWLQLHKEKVDHAFTQK